MVTLVAFSIKRKFSSFPPLLFLTYINYRAHFIVYKVNLASFAITGNITVTPYSGTNPVSPTTKRMFFLLFLVNLLILKVK
jgi:hypothetical protein